MNANVLLNIRFFLRYGELTVLFFSSFVTKRRVVLRLLLQEQQLTHCVLPLNFFLTKKKQ